MNGWASQQHRHQGGHRRSERTSEDTLGAGWTPVSMSARPRRDDFLMRAPDYSYLRRLQCSQQVRLGIGGAGGPVSGVFGEQPDSDPV